MSREVEPVMVVETSHFRERKGGMWKTYEAEIQFYTSFASGTPKHPIDIEAMLRNRMPAKPPAGAMSMPELVEQVEEEVEATEEVDRGAAAFKQDVLGLYYEARCVRAHIKDCANILRAKLGITGLKAKVANRLYVFPAKLRLERRDGDGWSPFSEPDGNEVRIIHTIDKKGPRTSLKAIDFVDDARLVFQLKVLNDGVVTKELLETIFEYGGIHGIGQERGQDWGKYQLVKLVEIE